jgi:hypothetical protein
VNRRFATVPLVAAALFGLVACGNSTGGTPTPATASPPTSGNADGSGVSTAAVQPCDLISASDATELQLTKGGPLSEGAARACTWSKPVDTNGQNGYTVEIGVRDNQSVSTFDSGGFTVTQDNIGRHQGIQAVGGGGCFVVIGVGTSSRVDVFVSTTDSTAAIQFANQVAKVVEPHLPGGGS